MTGTGLPPGPHLDLLLEALEAEAVGQAALLAGDAAAATPSFAAAARRYRASYECAPPASYGRIVGMLKAAVIAGDPTDAVAFARAALVDAGPTSTAGYARAIVGVIDGDGEGVRRGVEQMRGGDERFARAADALTAIVDRDASRYTRACQAIVTDFEQRSTHLTGVAIADTVVMLERLAERYGLSARPVSSVMPPT